MNERPWIPMLLVALIAISIPELAEANFLCPTCDAETAAPLGAAEVLDLVISTLLTKGISILLVGAAIVVGIPWVIAGVAVALIYVPRWLKA